MVVSDLSLLSALKNGDQPHKNRFQSLLAYLRIPITDIIKTGEARMKLGICLTW